MPNDNYGIWVYRNWGYCASKQCVHMKWWWKQQFFGLKTIFKNNRICQLCGMRRFPRLDYNYFNIMWLPYIELPCEMRFRNEIALPYCTYLPRQHRQVLQDLQVLYVFLLLYIKKTNPLDCFSWQFYYHLVYLVLMDHSISSHFLPLVLRVRREEQDLQRSRHSKEQSLRQLEASRNNRIRRFGENMPALLTAIDEAYKNGKFQKKPIGPLG